MNKLKVSIVTPVFNEESVIEPFHQRTSSVLKTLHDADAVIVYVVDKSTDNTLNILKRIAALDDFTRVIALSSRFGHQMSLLAGIENSLDSDAIIMMDSDLQHPPELIPSLLSHFKEGYDVVFTIRIDTEGIGVLRKTIGNIFYSLLNKISEIPINPNAADFRLISKRVANVLSTDFSERNLFLRGVFTWIGFSQTAVTYKAQKRGGGVSKYSLARMLKLAITGILSFSTKPLHIGVFAGCFFGIIAFFLFLATIVNYFFDSSLPSGWTTLVTLLLFFSALQLFVIGIMGVYIGGLYDEVKQRPKYIIEEFIDERKKQC